MFIFSSDELIVLESYYIDFGGIRGFFLVLSIIENGRFFLLLLEYVFLGGWLVGRFIGGIFWYKYVDMIIDKRYL